MATTFLLCWGVAVLVVRHRCPVRRAQRTAAHERRELVRLIERWAGHRE